MCVSHEASVYTFEIPCYSLSVWARKRGFIAFIEKKKKPIDNNKVRESGRS